MPKKPYVTGAPTKYREEYCEEVIELGKAGKSKVQMASHFNVARQTIDNWANDNPEFLEALNVAMAHSQTWWENAGQEGIFRQTNTFNAIVWKKTMECRFRDDYTDQKKMSFTGDIDYGVKVNELSDEQLLNIATACSEDSSSS